ncbi:Anaphase-promoting complex subunit 1 [Vermiconidia calcicola]|uniref:Anaphase-promoting complex subunit 1 n=1 Tax=Vermiconidia calcicola TaxID=1690605 RepID=A0ACC3NLY3_9PEZI|nr:Anaphase-promoting complex subunit 1 [Vermiconidia calcicola]
MAGITSLGVHTPVALPYLIAEGLLPHEPKTGLYSWETYVFAESQGEVEEEVLATKNCVVWSQGNFIRNVFRFDLEGEDLIQAILTKFPPSGDVGPKQGAKAQSDEGYSELNRDEGPSDLAPSCQEERPRSLERALVVFLKSKAHIYFLHGTNHVLDLPFEVARAFPAPRGAILQRKASSAPPSPPTPQIPAAPPNSFLSQLHPSSSYLQSPTLIKSFGSTQPNRPSPLTGKSRLDALFQDVLGSPSQRADDELAPLYTLTNPLSELGVITYSIQHPKPRLSGKTKPGMSVEFEPLDSAETVVYVSAVDELKSGKGHSQESLMLLVTINRDMQMCTIWHAWYIDEKSLSSLLKQRAAHKAAKARRRSSFLSVNIGTGATTPAVRNREGTRESFAGAGSMRLPGEPSGAHQLGASSRKPTRQEEEEAMASQMDPDYQPSASQQAARESRRISSLNTDVRASQHNVTASFGGPGGRRNASFGGPNERKSFGHRKSRGSTPGSINSRSLGPDDDLMDLDSSMDADGEETLESIVRHIRATFDAVGAESIFGGAGDNFKRELVVRKLHSFPLASGGSNLDHHANSIRVLTLMGRSPQHALNVYIHQRQAKDLMCLRLKIKRRSLWPEMPDSPSITIPIYLGETKLEQCNDIVKLRHDSVDAVLLGDRGLILSIDDRKPCSLPKPAPYRMYNALAMYSIEASVDRDIGRNRVLEDPDRSGLSLVNAGSNGRYDERTSDGVHHRRQLQLRPKDDFVGRLLEVCQSVLPSRHSKAIPTLWCLAHAFLLERPDQMERTTASTDWVAFATTVFVLVINMIDERARAALRVSSVAVSKTSAKPSSQLRQRQHGRQSMQKSTWSWMDEDRQRSGKASTTSPRGPSKASKGKDQLATIAAALAVELQQSAAPWASSHESLALSSSDAMRLIIGLHIFREEQKLCTLSSNGQDSNLLALVVAQLGTWYSLIPWSHETGQYYELEGASEERWSFVRTVDRLPPQLPLMDEPVGVFHWFEHALDVQSGERYPTLDVIANLSAEMLSSKARNEFAVQLTPRISKLSDMLEATSGLNASSTITVELMAKHGITREFMETLPDAIAAPFREAIVRCEREPPTTWSPELLALVGREDLVVKFNDHIITPPKPNATIAGAPRDVQSVCHALEHHPYNAKTKEASRHAVSQLIFHEDRRLIEATSLMHFNSIQVAECPKQPDWSDAHHFEQQRKMMQWVTVRMIALPAGDAMIHYDCQTPLLTDKYHLPGFSSACLMQPMGHTLTTDRSGLTEEKVNWAYFHAGVSVGLRVSHNVQGIDTSWIAFNKPNELTNRHAGLLLALGLGGHLRHLAKWLSFKYLTPKHTMTSVGLLLGLSASYMGTMDSLITRMLSVHITRMLPPGAAELNVSPITQTAGLMGIGLLYYNTQHRRMSEIMLSEVEHMELEDPDSGPDPLRDESYRLAAGFALGYINLGKGKNLRGLHGMYLPERLLAIAVGPRPVNAVHIFDRATAGAVVALALVYMKSGDGAIARKIDIPDTETQFDHVRADMLMLRAMTKNVILWDGIVVNEPSSGAPSWIQANLPACYKTRFEYITASSGRHPLKSADVPFFNIVTGLAWALGVKYAGSGNTHARDEILSVLNYFYMVKGGADAYYYDAKLARSTVRRCIDVLALAAATVMAGTGDLQTFRYLRRLHGRTDPETPYGSHFAAHLAIGVLFLGGGTYTLGTSNLAVASMICAFYPLFPTDVYDNHVHLQAFRHLWVFAAEARCLVVEEIDTHRPISMPIIVMLTSGATKALTAPCLLPDLDTIATVQTNDPAYWRVTLDFSSNPAHLAAFRKNQRIFVRRCPASEAHNSVFSSTLTALNSNNPLVPSSNNNDKQWQTTLLTSLPTFKDLDKADLELILPPSAGAAGDVHCALFTDERGTVVDDRLALTRSAMFGTERDELWNLRVLLAWAERARESGEDMRWLGEEVVEELRARVEERRRVVSG